MTTSVASIEVEPKESSKNFQNMPQNLQGILNPMKHPTRRVFDLVILQILAWKWRASRLFIPNLLICLVHPAKTTLTQNNFQHVIIMFNKYVSTVPFPSNFAHTQTPPQVFTDDPDCIKTFVLENINLGNSDPPRKLLENQKSNKQLRLKSWNWMTLKPVLCWNLGNHYPASKLFQIIFQVTWVDAWVQVVLPSHWCEPENFGKPRGPLNTWIFPKNDAFLEWILLSWILKDLGKLQNRSRWSWRLRGSQGAWLMVQIASGLQKNCLWHLPQITQTFFSKIDFQALKTLKWRFVLL